MGLDHYKTLLVCRNRLRNLSVATTGTLSLGVTGNAFVRATGSFSTDGFVPGMEVVPTGFVDATPQVITKVEDLKLTLLGALADDASTGGRSLTVGLPPIRAWEGVSVKPVDDRWYINEDYLPGGSPRRVTSGIDTAEFEYEPIYNVHLLGVDKLGVQALYKVADSILSLFKPYDAIGTVDGRAVVVRNDMNPYRGQALPTEPGRLEVLITIPLRVRTFNS